MLIGCIFIFLAIDFIFSTYRTDYALNKLYLAGFFISIASLFWAPFAIFILLIWISLIIVRPFIGREWIVGILGFLTPYLFVFVYFFVFKEQSSLIEIYNRFLINFEFIDYYKIIHQSYYIFYSLLLLIIILASYTIIIDYQKKKIKTRKYFEINLWLFVISMSLFLIFKNIKYEIFYLLGIPLSYLLTDYFYIVKREWYLNTILLLIIGSLVYIQIIAHFH